MAEGSIVQNTLNSLRNGHALPAMSRDEEARLKYRELAAQPAVEDEVYVIDIIRNNWRNDQSI